MFSDTHDYGDFSSAELSSKSSATGGNNIGSRDSGINVTVLAVGSAIFVFGILGLVLIAAKIK